MQVSAARDIKPVRGRLRFWFRLPATLASEGQMSVYAWSEAGPCESTLASVNLPASGRSTGCDGVTSIARGAARPRRDAPRKNCGSIATPPVSRMSVHARARVDRFGASQGLSSTFCSGTWCELGTCGSAGINSSRVMPGDFTTRNRVTVRVQCEQVMLSVQKFTLPLRQLAAVSFARATEFIIGQQIGAAAVQFRAPVELVFGRDRTARQFRRTGGERGIQLCARRISM